MSTGRGRGAGSERGRPIDGAEAGERFAGSCEAREGLHAIVDRAPCPHGLPAHRAVSGGVSLAGSLAHAGMGSGCAGLLGFCVLTLRLLPILWRCWPGSTWSRRTRTGLLPSVSLDFSKCSDRPPLRFCSRWLGGLAYRPMLRPPPKCSCYGLERCDRGDGLGVDRHSLRSAGWALRQLRAGLWVGDAPWSDLARLGALLRDYIDDLVALCHGVDRVQLHQRPWRDRQLLRRLAGPPLATPSSGAKTSLPQLALPALPSGCAGVGARLPVLHRACG